MRVCLASRALLIKERNLGAVNTAFGTSTPTGVAPDIPLNHIVVAAVIQWRGRIALFRRSGRSSHDPGLWQCITGFLSAGATPEQQALEELFKEAGLRVEDLQALHQGPDLVVTDRSGTPWLVHTFTALTYRRRLGINREYDCYRWTDPRKAKRFANRVSWLDSVLSATGHGTSSVPAPQPAVAPRDEARPAVGSMNGTSLRAHSV
ncbi:MULTISPECIES: NUDIX domain-containing protein [unclassified Arthrobacter]|uniref:NUDIX domain-containing protein n=1 Tax=unclassified Arthrobacter TaxID=235627 RepID=UPI0035B05676